MKKAVIFDMDGTMFDTERIWRENWERLIPDFGFTHNPEFPSKICGTSGEGTNEVIRKFYPGIDVGAYRSAVRAAVDSAIEKEVPVKEGLYELVDYLEAQGVCLAIASSSRLEKIEHCVRMTNLEGRFDVLVSGDRLEHGKPAPDIFLNTAKALGLDPAECYVLEDSLNGVYAGIASGAATVMVIDVTPPDERAKEGCVGVYDSLTQVLRAMKAGEI